MSKLLQHKQLELVSEKLKNNKAIIKNQIKLFSLFKYLIISKVKLVIKRLHVNQQMSTRNSI